ncbi:MAG: TetR/AcrR family transcriptional regulator [Burkholderiales bacterium]
MRYPPGHNEQARRQLLEAGGRHAKKHGFAGSGVDALAQAAGVTTGSLYKHFDGKNDLFAELIGHELERTAKRFAAVSSGDSAEAMKVLTKYLSLNHVRHPEAGCALPVLAAEVARAERPVKDAYQAGLQAIHAAVADRFTGSEEAAWALIAQSVGAVMLARAMAEEDVARTILDTVAAAGADLLRSADQAAGQLGRVR